MEASGMNSLKLSSSKLKGQNCERKVHPSIGISTIYDQYMHVQFFSVMDTRQQLRCQNAKGNLLLPKLMTSQITNSICHCFIIIHKSLTQ